MTEARNAHADLDFDKDKRVIVVFFTKALEVLGWE